MKTYKNVQVWEEKITIPTYQVGKADKNPMFLEKRVYQGSTGKVYPHTVIDKIQDEKTDVEYKAVYIENDFIKVMVLPEIGGRIQRATDKTTGYDFVYYNHVIKPALVGLAGPWISGGIEFNWPQHHRPSTFDEVNYCYEKNDDGSASIIVGEIENMFRTKGMARFTLYPDSTYIEIKAQLFNRTDIPQTFLWWANPAVAVNDNTRSIFPPDVTAVMDHGKRAVSTFPIATGTYYKVDYSAGVDISRYKNLPVPTSYMAAKSDYDFVGGYDDGTGAGILHVADHHVSPGKKQWTWGCGDFGKAWDRNLTDSDGPYVELMTGCFTDNQPDFSWIAPMEEKRFTQYFMPYNKLGTVHNATKDLAMNLESGCVNLLATGNVGEITLNVYDGEKNVLSQEISLAATEFKSIDISDFSVKKVVILKNGRKYLSYLPDGKKQEVLPAAKCPPSPKDCETNEDLYLYGLHIEQYRHATYDPADYYLEGLRRDSTDIRLNNAYGLLLMRRGLFKESEKYFAVAVEKATRSNPNPYDSEPYYNLGIALLFQNRVEESYDAFYKSAWSNSSQEAAFYHMACICCKKGDYSLALEHVENAIIKNGRNYKALNLKALILLEMGKKDEGESLAKYILSLDPLDIVSKRILEKNEKINHNTSIEIAIEYAKAGFFKEAVKVLEEDESGYPLVSYYLAEYHRTLGNNEKSKKCLEKAEKDNPYGCFPHRLEDIGVLQNAIGKNGKDSMALYYLGNLFYDKKRYEEAIECFEKSAMLNDSFPTSHRNLALAYFNKKGESENAVKQMEKAFSLDVTDARVLMELDQLYKKLQYPAEKRLDFLKKHFDTVKQRDDLYLEYITLLNMVSEHEKAYEYIMARTFHPWEGGEGKVPNQYVFALCTIAKNAIDKQENELAVETINKAFVYPHNLGEGKLYGAQENLQNYLLGLAYENMDAKKAKGFFETATTGLSEPKSAMYYNDQPPETIFCQGMAMMKLGEKDKAFALFDKLIDFSKKHYDDKVSIDYFAVSLPDFLVFDEDLDKKNKVHCLFMEALGLLGKGQKDEAQSCLKKAKDMDLSHFGINLYTKLFV